METQNLNEGDVVLVMSSDTARGQWPLGRICKVLPDRDNKVRVAEVLLSSGNKLVRPVVKLIPLDVHE